MAVPDGNLLAKGFPCNVAVDNAFKMMTEATSQLSTDEIRSALAYGKSMGDDNIRTVFGRFLSDQYGENISKSNVVVSGGSSWSLYHVAIKTLPDNCKFLIEEVSYFLAIISIQKDLNAELVPVQCGVDGVDLDDLEEKMQVEFNSCSADQTYSCAFYVMPTFHNPRGYCYPPELSYAVVRLAKKYKALLICDDVYVLLCGKEDMPRRLRSYALETDADDYVVSLGSFSKIGAPGYRLGWIEGSVDVVAKLSEFTVLTSGCNFGHYQSYVIAKAIENGSLVNHINMVRDLLQERLEFLHNRVAAALPLGSRIVKPKGGYFLWIELPEKINIRRLKEISNEDFQVDFQSGEKFSVVGKHQNCLRLSFGSLTMDRLKPVADKFIASLEKYMSELNDLTTAEE